MLVIDNYAKDLIGRMLMRNSWGNILWVNLYNCNALGAYCVRQYDDKEKDIVATSLWGFWADEEHLKNMLGLNKGYNNAYGDDIISIELVKPRNKNEEIKIMKIAKNFIKAKYKVTCNVKEYWQIIYNENYNGNDVNDYVFVGE